MSEVSPGSVRELRERTGAGMMDCKKALTEVNGDVEKAHVKRFSVAAYPTIVVLDSAGAELRRVVGYQASKETIALIK